MALTDEQQLEMYKNITEMHGFMSEIKERGCSKGMEEIKNVAINLEKNNRDHIRVKAIMALMSIAGGLAIYWKKLFGG